MRGATTVITCAHCNRRRRKHTGSVNRAHKIGAPLYCNKICAGKARRNGKTKAERVEEKRLYDAAYRAKNLPRIRRRKADYHRRTYDPAKAARKRKRRMPYHIEYCRRFEYRVWKSEYDSKRRAKEYGPFAEAFLLLQAIDREVSSRMSDYDVRQANGTLNKRQQRKREYESLVGS